jgi:peroxiredoxin
MRYLIAPAILGGLALAAVLFGFHIMSDRAQGEQPVEMKVDAPDFVGIEDWINSKPLTWKDLKGQVVVLHFWTFGWINCIHNYPSYGNWQEKFSKKGVTIIGVHTPELDKEKDLEAVKKKVKANKMEYPIAVDAKGKTWAAWNNQYWPTVYLVDKKGKVRFRWDGELNSGDAKGEEIMTEKIKELLKEKE